MAPPPVEKYGVFSSSSVVCVVQGSHSRQYCIISTVCIILTISLNSGQGRHGTVRGFLVATIAVQAVRVLGVGRDLSFDKDWVRRGLEISWLSTRRKVIGESGDICVVCDDLHLAEWSYG